MFASRVSHCVKSVRIRSYSGPNFHAIGLIRRDVFYAVTFVAKKCSHRDIHVLHEFTVSLGYFFKKKQKQKKPPKICM